MMREHWSDCAVHNEPAFLAGPCNCGGVPVTNEDIQQADLRELLLILGMGDHARAQSPHEVFQEALGVLRERLAQSPNSHQSARGIESPRTALSEPFWVGISIPIDGTQPMSDTLLRIYRRVATGTRGAFMAPGDVAHLIAEIDRLRAGDGAI